MLVINLEARKDRWQKVAQIASSLNLNIVRVGGVSPSEFDPVSNKYLDQTIFAIWLSHKKALKKLIDLGSEHGLILEDDFEPSSNFNLEFLEECAALKFDFCQIGFLQESFWDRIDISFQTLRDQFLKILSRINLPKVLDSKFLIREQDNIPFMFIKNDIRAGAHAYLVSRKFALSMQEINSSPTFLSADLLYMSVGEMRTFNMVRLKKSLIGQDCSPSSVVNRFKK